MWATRRSFQAHSSSQQQRPAGMGHPEKFVQWMTARISSQWYCS
jgi:hypothetical protein